MGDRGITHGLKYQARAIAPVIAEKQRSCWLVGTNALREENEVQVLEFDSERDALWPVAVYVHPPEIWSITPSASDPSAFITVHNTGGQYGATLWKAQPQRHELQQVTQLGGCQGALHTVLWQDTSLASVEDGRLRLWALADGAARESSSAVPSGGAQLQGGCWDPHDPHRIATAGGNGFQLWDARTGEESASWPAAHALPTRDVDFSRQNPHMLLTTGDDCRLRFWDLRRGSGAEPLLEMGGHAHTVWQARHNPFHDELLVSCSSDASVSLWYAPSVVAAAAAAVPVASSGGRAGGGAPRAVRGKTLADGRAAVWKDHEESVYGVAWSSVEPWVFASISYDGRVAINRVPSQVKYKILI